MAVNNVVPIPKKRRKLKRKAVRAPRFTDEILLTFVRDLTSADDGRVAFDPHSKARMRSRGFSDTQVKALLKSRMSNIVGEHEEEISGDIKMTICGTAAGDRLHVTVVLKEPIGEMLLIITVVSRK